MRRRLTLIGIFAVVTVTHAAEPQRDEFAHEMPLVLDGSASVYRARLTADVYRNLSRADLGDLRVFNAAGEVVPYGLSRPATEASAQYSRLPLFPIPATSPQTAADISMSVERGKDGSIVSIRTTGAGAGDRLAYLADASKVEGPIGALTFDWEQGDTAGFIATLQVEESDDLKVWRPVAQGTLARLTHDGGSLAQQRISLTPQHLKYLRLSWTNPETSTRLSAITAEVRSSVEPQRDWLAPVRAPGGDPSEHRFRLDGRAPVDHARVLLPVNSVARVSVLSRGKDGDAWELRAMKTVYLLETANGELKDTDMRLTRSGPAREWLVRLDRNANAVSLVDFSLELGWIPHDLIFVARGQAPFVLTYGNATARPADFGVDDLMQRLERENIQRVEIREATLAMPRPLRGAAALETPWHARDWKQWLLWGVLLCGVGVLAYVASRLVRRLDATRSD